MKKNTPLLLPMLASLLCLSPLAKSQTARPSPAQIQAIIGKMTVEEKVNMVMGQGKKPTNTNLGGVGITDDKVPGAAGITLAIPRLGIPSMVLADGPAGVRITPIRNNDSSKTYYATAFPVGTLLASTWDTALIQKVGLAIGNEVKQYGIDVLLAPAINIHRNPLGGRNFEYCSEDPIVSGHMAAAYINGVQANGVGTSIKHFAANNQETNRMEVNTIVSQRALREIYLRGFEIVIKQAQPWTVMSSYNRINGVYTSESKDLLTTILRNEWGYKGFVMTDWFGGSNAANQLMAGNNLLMPGKAIQKQQLLTACSTNPNFINILNQDIAGILNTVYQSPAYKKVNFTNKPNLAAHALVARNAAAQGMVLLKNDNQALPLAAAQKTVAAFGNTSYDFISGGSGSGDVYEAYTISLVQGLQNAGLQINASLQATYQQYINTQKATRPKPTSIFALVPPLPEMQLSNSIITAQASQSAVAIVTIGRNSGEFQDRKIEGDFNLTTQEVDLIKNVAAAFHAQGKKLIVLLNIGGVIETESWKQYPDAILLTWQGGQEAGNAVADIVTGKVNPSGKLTTTFPVQYADVPSAKNFPGVDLDTIDIKEDFGLIRGRNSQVVYKEGIYVGYRYYSTFNIKPSYCFGHGLSYTSFAYGPLSLSSSSFANSIKASITITNTGKLAGKEVVQLYLTAPIASINKPAFELKAFAKTNRLQPGQSQTLIFTLYPKDLASFYTKTSSWVANAGSYKVYVAASAADVRQSATFSLSKELLVEKTNAVLPPPTEINEAFR